MDKLTKELRYNEGKYARILLMTYIVIVTPIKNALSLI